MTGGFGRCVCGVQTQYSEWVEVAVSAFYVCVGPSHEEVG